MIEVEAKARILHPDKLRVIIQKIAHYKGKERKTDDYYTLEGPKSYPLKSLRIRKKGKIFQVNFKQRLETTKDIDVKNETEFELENIDSMISLLKEFGFKKWVTKEKYTEIYQVHKNLNIELNHVKGLGWFVEIEYMANRKEVDKAKKEVLDTLKKIQIDKKDIVTKGYTKLLWEKTK